MWPDDRRARRRDPGVPSAGQPAWWPQGLNSVAYASWRLPRIWPSQRIYAVVVPPSLSSPKAAAGESAQEVALESLLAPLLLPAYKLAFSLLRSRDEAEDAVQEAALSAWKHRQAFRAGADPRPWFFAIVANHCRSVRRGRWSRLLRLADPVVRSEPSGDVEADMDLRRAINRLGHKDRLALVLRYYVDLSFDEVAQTLGISEQAARSRIQRAVRRLRVHLNQPEELIP
jgi:RNA polymerase sigma-70 factor (ECF subfamily)